MRADVPSRWAILTKPRPRAFRTEANIDGMILRPSNTVLKRDGDSATQDAATTAGRADAKKMKNARQPVGRIMVGQNLEKPTR